MQMLLLSEPASGGVQLLPFLVTPDVWKLQGPARIFRILSHLEGGDGRLNWETFYGLPRHK
jgi:hypothetical protein